MVRGHAALLGACEHEGELLADLGLADKLGERLGAQGTLDVVLAGLLKGVDVRVAVRRGNTRRRGRRSLGRKIIRKLKFGALYIAHGHLS